jgi:hypothetical protein
MKVISKLELQDGLRKKTDDEGKDQLWLSRRILGHLFIF